MNTKRLLDGIVSAVALISLSPLFLLIAVAIWLEDGGPVIFKQKRIGRNGRIFNIYKFRKLKHRPNESTPLLMTRDDALYSLVGRFLDSTKLNELPQLLNILKGDMSIVGPRPEIPQFLHCFDGQYRDLLNYNPGIFGPSQSAFSKEADMYPPGGDMTRFYEDVLFARKAKMDLRYYPKATLLTDLYWIYRSVLAVLVTGRSVQHNPASLRH